VTRSLYEPSLYRADAKNRFGIQSLKQKPLASRWWVPNCTVGVDGGCTGLEPPLLNSWAQPALPLEKFAFRLHADGSLEFRGHLDSAAATSGTVAVTLPGAVPGEVDFLPPNDQFFVSAIYDGAAAQPALVYIDSTTGDVTVTFPI
jgi:hypothetical protein